MLDHTKNLFFVCIYLALTISTFLVYSQVSNFDFINYDDDTYFYENPNILTGTISSSIIWAFTTNYQGNWHPLTWLSYILDFRLFGTNPGWLHLENVFLHLASTLLLFTILSKATKNALPSAFVAAAFALHPMHVESVAWIAERKDVLSTLFCMLTLLAYIVYVKNNKTFFYFLSLGIFALGLMTKPMLVTLPFVLLLFDCWPLNRFELPHEKIPHRRTQKPNVNNHANRYWIITEKIPFFVLSTTLCTITFLVQRSGGLLNSASLDQRIANASVSYTRYLLKMVWPQNLAVFYPFTVHGFEFWQIVSCILLLGVMTVLVLRFGYSKKYLPVGWFFFLVTLLPVIGLVKVGNQAYADRYTYIPYIGLFIIIAWGLPELFLGWTHRKVFLGAFASVMLIAIAITSYRQVSLWQNSVPLFSHALEVTQNNYIAHDHLAVELAKQGNIALAIEHYEEAVKIKPDYAHAILSLGNIFADKGDTNQAIWYFQKALRLKSTRSYASTYAHYNLGLLMLNLGKFDESLNHFRQAVQLKPDFIDARYNFAVTLSQQGRLDEALEQFRAVSRLRTDLPFPMNQIAWCLATHPEIKCRDPNEALFLACRACELTNYKNPVFLGTLAAAYASSSRFPEAVATAQKAVTLTEISNQPDIKNMLQHHLSFYLQGKPYIEPSPKLVDNRDKH